MATAPRSPRGAGPLVRLAYRAVQRVMVLDVTRVLWLDCGASRLAPSGGGYEFRFLSVEETAAHARRPENQLDEAFAARIQGGTDLCFAALAGDSLAAYLWLALGSIEAEQNRGSHPLSGVAVSFPRDVAFVYRAFTLPQHRGRRLYPGCLGRALAELAPWGVRHLLSTTDWSNRSAMAGFRRAGFRDLGLLWRFGRGQRLFCIAPGAARQLGVCFDRQAIVQPRQVAASAV